MTNYLIMPKNTPEHYFYQNGIYMRRRSKRGVWHNSVPVLKEGMDGFGIYSAKDGAVHLICTDRSRNLIYAVSAGDEWKKYVISKLSADISVCDMRLYSIRGRLNLIYSAIYNGENLLVHCILGDHAKPSTVDTLETPHFFIKGNKVYYTNTNGVLGFVNLADEKPSVFTPLYEDAHFGTVYSIDGKEKVLFSRNSSVFLDGKEIASDTHMEMPILVTSDKTIYLMWKNGGFIRYTVSDNGGNFGSLKRFMTSGRSMDLYLAQKSGNFELFYGYHTENSLTLLGNPQIFEEFSGYRASAPSELERVKNMLNKTEQEISDAKKELARLGKVIQSLTDRK